MKTQICLPIVALLFSSTALADTGVPHTFNAGDPIVAAQVNANFADLASRLEYLEEQLSENSLYDEISGSTYHMLALGTELDTSSHLQWSEPPRLANWSFSGNWTFNADGTMSFLNQFVETDISIDPESGTENDFRYETYIEEPELVYGTWQLDGNLLTAVLDEEEGDSITGTVSSNGDIVTFDLTYIEEVAPEPGSAATEPFNVIEHAIGIAVRSATVD